MQKDKKDNPQGKGAFGPVAAGIAGAAIGAAAVALSDKKNRQKISKVVDDVTEKSKKAIKDLRRAVEDRVIPKAQELRKKGEEEKEKVEKKLSNDDKN
ncbi:MAG: hypothetical protein Q7K55_01085 [Candidatus Levybacteria bacterium]|nr:hypothetical protein [Candidatus Levybacteria bacterium]